MSLVEKFEAPERPAYRVLDPAGFFGPDDTLYLEGAEIYLDTEPSVEMEPLNEAARKKMEALLNKLDDMGRAVAEKLGRPFVGRPRNLEGALELATSIERQNRSVMGDKNKHVDSIETIAKEDVPQLGTPKRGPGRPKKVA